MGLMQVKCKFCGAMNEKAPEQYKVVCGQCKKETTYFVQPGARKG